MKISLVVLSLLVFAELTTSKKQKEKKKKETKFNYYPVKDVQGNVIFSKI